MGMYCILVFIIYNCDNIFNFYDGICYKNLIYYLIFVIVYVYLYVLYFWNIYVYLVMFYLFFSFLYRIELFVLRIKIMLNYFFGKNLYLW